MKRLIAQLLETSERTFAVLLALSLLLMLPASPYQKLAASAVSPEDRVATVSADDSERPAPTTSPDDGRDGQWVIQLFEDDVLHEDHVCVAPSLELRVLRTEPLQPDDPHTARLERPPLFAA